MAIKSPEKEIKNTKNEKIQPTADQKNKVPFMVVEAYKNLRVQLIAALAKKNGKIVAVSSANADEGKSTTSVNLAITLSQLNKKVMLIDTDGRRGTVHHKLKIENNVGCLDVLEGKAEWGEVVKSYNQYLDVITLGAVSNNTTELFASNTFDRMLTEIKNEYDYVILDTPPINLLSDTLIISQKSDGLVLVVRSNVTTYDEFRDAKASIDQLNVNLLGVVINGEEGENKGYYKYGRKKYSKKYYGNK